MSFARVTGLALAIFALLAARLPAASEPAAGVDLAAQIRKDRDASIRFLELRLARERRFVQAGAEDRAQKLEAETLRQEAKALERTLWYLKRDRKYAARVKVLTAGLEDLRKKDPKASLEARKQAGFAPDPLVSDPLGLSPTATPAEAKP